MSNITAKILNIASILLAAVGVVGVMTALLDLTAPIDESVLGVNTVQIATFNSNVLGLITHLYQSVGLYLLGMGLFFCLVSILPFRRGQKWAWYSMFVVGGIGLVGQIALAYFAGGVIAPYYLPAALLLVVPWAIAIAISAKQMHT